MNLRQLEIFRAVMISGTTVGAAEMLNVSQPAISNMILHTEDQLKFKLFLRQRGRLIPTDEAVLLFEYSQKVFNAFDETQFIVDRIKGALIGEVRIVCTPAFSNTMVPRAVARFREQRSDVKISVEVGSLDFVFEAIEKGQAHLGVHFTPREHPLISSQPLGDLSMVCALPKSHPLAEKDVVEPTDILKYPFISCSSNEPFGALVDNAFRQFGLKAERAIQVRYIYTACELVSLNQGIAVVEPYLLLAADRYPELTFRAFRPQITTTTSVITNKSKPLGTLSKIFLEDLKFVFQELEDHEQVRVHFAMRQE